MYPLIKMHGGKFKINDWIIDHFPPYYREMTYIECFVGGGSIILNKKPSFKEIINDIDKDLINIYQVLINDIDKLINQLETYKYSEEIFEEALRDKNFDDNIDQACNTYIIKRMSRGGLGLNFAWSNRLRGDQPGDINAWENSIENLYDIKKRLNNVIILNEHFREVLTLYNDSDTFFYLDPPYMHQTRTSKENYTHEMSDTAHIELLQIINKSQTKILLSGYDSLLYNYNLKDWNRYEKIVANHSGQNKIKNKRIEVLWSNY